MPTPWLRTTRRRRLPHCRAGRGGTLWGIRARPHSPAAVGQVGNAFVSVMRDAFGLARYACGTQIVAWQSRIR